MVVVRANECGNRERRSVRNQEWRNMNGKMDEQSLPSQPCETFATVIGSGVLTTARSMITTVAQARQVPTITPKLVILPLLVLVLVLVVVLVLFGMLSLKRSLW